MEKFAGYAFALTRQLCAAELSDRMAEDTLPGGIHGRQPFGGYAEYCRVVILVDEVRRMKLALLPPSVNR